MIIILCGLFVAILSIAFIGLNGLGFFVFGTAIFSAIAYVAIKLIPGSLGRIASVVLAIAIVLMLGKHFLGKDLTGVVANVSESKKGILANMLNKNALGDLPAGVMEGKVLEDSVIYDEDGNPTSVYAKTDDEFKTLDLERRQFKNSPETFVHIMLKGINNDYVGGSFGWIPVSKIFIGAAGKKTVVAEKKQDQQFLQAIFSEGTYKLSPPTEVSTDQGKTWSGKISTFVVDKGTIQYLFKNKEVTIEKVEGTQEKTQEEFFGEYQVGNYPQSIVRLSEGIYSVEPNTEGIFIRFYLGPGKWKDKSISKEGIFSVDYGENAFAIGGVSGNFKIYKS
jgi:hypothetical protein